MAHESTQAKPRPSVGILLSQAGLHAREQELDQLRAVKRDDIARRLREARGYGEPGSNDEYMATREDEAIIDARIAALQTMLAQATVVEHHGRPGVVGIGSVVTVDETANGGGARYRLVGSHEAQAPGDVSIGLTGRPGTAGTRGRRHRRRAPSRRSHTRAADRLGCAADVASLLRAALPSRRADAIPSRPPSRVARRPGQRR